MRILTRYILGEILSHTLIGCALFSFILFMPYLPNVLEMVVRNSSTFSNAAEIFLFTLPNLFRVTIPMSVLVGVLLGLSRLAADSEIIAMRASGLGIGYFVRVSSIVAICGTLLGLANSLYLAPRANQAILDMEQALETSQASYQIQPRVFYEDFKNFVLYVQNVHSGTGASNWDQVFMADVSDPSAPRITTAASATVASDSSQVLLMRLRNGAQHDTVDDQPDQYNISAFSTTDRPLELSAQSDVHLGRLDTAIYALPMRALVQRSHGPDSRRFLIELNNRFAFPVACLVLMLVGVPLGVTSRRGGKSSGFVYTILLVFLYYFLSSTGIALGRQNKLPAFLAVWSANLLFAVVGVFLLWQMASGGRVLAAITSSPLARVPARIQRRTPRKPSPLSSLVAQLHAVRNAAIPPRLSPHPRRIRRTRVPLHLPPRPPPASSSSCSSSPSSISSETSSAIAFPSPPSALTSSTSHPTCSTRSLPLAVLIATLVTFGVLNRNSEIIAMKATGISLYRLVVPIVSISVILAISLFLFDQYYLPQANRRQEALRNTIKGRPPQTVAHPEHNWIFGQPRPGEPGRIFYYQFFDPDRKEFANLSVFEFDPSTFSLTRRIFASRVYRDTDSGAWRFQNGWVRDMNGAKPSPFASSARPPSLKSTKTPAISPKRISSPRR